MSVIPLTIEGPHRTIVQRQEDFDNKGGALYIRGLDLDQLADPDNSNAAYDLRVGSQFRDHRERSVKEIPDNAVITVHPGEALIIQTEEDLHLPQSMYGTIAPKVSLLQLGLSTTFSKIDPGYYGHLLITLFNLGKTSVPLHRREAFCALTIFEVKPGARMYNKGTKHITGEPAKQPRRSLRDFIHTYPALAGALVTAAASLLLGLVNLVLFLLRG